MAAGISLTAESRKLDFHHRESIPDAKLNASLRGKTIFAFGTAAEADTNGTKLREHQEKFGFQEVEVTDPQLFLRNVSEYRETKESSAVIYANISFHPDSRRNFAAALSETAEMAKAFVPYVDGFVWDARCTTLRDPEIFGQTAELIRGICLSMHEDKILLARVGSYKYYERGQCFKLFQNFLEKGGDGFVITNVYAPLYKKDPVCHNIEEIRCPFPEAIIIGSISFAGTYSALATFMDGANAVSGFSSKTKGTLFLDKQVQEVTDYLEMKGYRDLSQIRRTEEDGYH